MFFQVKNLLKDFLELPRELEKYMLISNNKSMNFNFNQFGSQFSQNILTAHELI